MRGCGGSEVCSGEHLLPGRGGSRSAADGGAGHGGAGEHLLAVDHEQHEPADFEAYLAQFPNGVFRSLAENRLAALREGPDGPGAGGGPRVGSTGNAPADAGHPTADWSIDFGDDSGDFAREGECDDPRFEGDGMSLPSGVFGERGRDAADCRQLHDEGRIRLFGVDLDSGVIDFGDDTGDRALNGECNDPRFDGGGTDAFTHPYDRGHDATDCRALYDAGRLHLFGVNVATVR